MERRSEGDRKGFLSLLARHWFPLTGEQRHLLHLHSQGWHHAGHHLRGGWVLVRRRGGHSCRVVDPIRHMAKGGSVHEQAEDRPGGRQRQTSSSPAWPSTYHRTSRILQHHEHSKHRRCPAKTISVPLKMVPSPPYFARTLADLLVRRS